MNSGQNWQGFLQRADVFPLQPSADEESELSRASISARDWLLKQQKSSGEWDAVHQSDVSPTVEFLLLLKWLTSDVTEEATVAPSIKSIEAHTTPESFEKFAAFIRAHQLQEGGWSRLGSSDADLSLSVLAYLSLRLAGDFATSLHMQKAAGRIRALGGGESCDVVTRFYLAMFGVISYNDCPVIPPEVLLLPRWAPLNVEKMSAWAQSCLLPLSLIWANQPVVCQASQLRVDEIFLSRPVQMPIPNSDHRRSSIRNWLKPDYSWKATIRTFESVWRFFERIHTKPFRWRSIRLARKWLFNRLSSLDGLPHTPRAAIFSIIALKTLNKDSALPLLEKQGLSLSRLVSHAGEQSFLQAWSTPVTDTALAIQSLRLNGVSASHPQLFRGVSWLLQKQCQLKDGASFKPSTETQRGIGWNAVGQDPCRPEVAATSLVCQAISKCLPGTSGTIDWSAWLMSQKGVQAKADFDLAVILSCQSSNSINVVADVTRMQPMIQAMRAATKWLASMQSSAGGWGRFSRDQISETYENYPFYDQVFLGDPALTDLTAQVLELFGQLGLASQEPMFERAIKVIWDAQEVDNCWRGDLGIHYLWGTYKVISGLMSFGVSAQDSRIQAAGRWLKEKQNPDGGWGESPRSCQDATLRGRGDSTPEQTAWAVLALIAAEEGCSAHVKRGIQYLIKTQDEHGTWNSQQPTLQPLPGHALDQNSVAAHCYPMQALSKYSTNRY